MPLTFEFEFAYSDDPEIAIRVASPETGTSWATFAYIDTGAQRTILDSLVAEEIGLELAHAEKIALFGLGGALEAVVAEVDISLLGEPELTFRLPVVFAPLISTRLGNLIGLDVLSRVSFGLDHGQRLGYLGPALP